MEPTICVVGLGYVGLPLAVEFGKVLPTIGFDISARRISELKAGHDRTLEASEQELRDSIGLSLTSDPAGIAGANHFIVTVPTPIDQHKRPDLAPLIAASRTVGSVLKRGDIVIFESTVYPGATEEVCVPELEAVSGLTLDDHFNVGYSPERINPGDNLHRLTSITKVTSGSTPEAAQRVDDLYARIIKAGTHRAPSIRVAEAAKVIENTQRDVNIALMNELAILFGKLGIDTNDVLDAAGTKWNFLPFRPGLVGGHCIGVDPYYLTHKAQEVGHHAEVILAGRRINDAMGTYVADQTVLLMARKGIPIGGARALVLGLAFKENCPDLRNTRVVDVIARLAEYGMSVDVADPWVDAREAIAEYGVGMKEFDRLEDGSYDAVVMAVAHQEFLVRGSYISRLVTTGGVLFDVKSAFPLDLVDGRL